MPTCVMYTVVDLTPSTSGLATDINQNGFVCGWEAGLNAFIYIPQGPGGNVLNLPPPLGITAQAFGLNNRGDVVGSSGVFPGGIEIPFLWLDCSSGGCSGFHLAPLVLFGPGRANAINESRIIVGWSSTQPVGSTFRRAVFWDGNNPSHSPIPLDALDPNLESEAYGINDQNIIVGKAQFRNTFGNIEEHAVIWDANTRKITRDLGTLTSVLPIRPVLPFTDLKAEATAINNSGTIVGVGDVSSAPIRPRTGFIVRPGGGMELIPMGPSTNAGAWDISPNGTIALTTNVLNPDTNQLEDHGAIYSITKGLLDIHTTSCGAAPGGHGLSGGWILTDARSVNDKGWICGRGSTSVARNHALLLVPTP